MDLTVTSATYLVMVNKLCVCQVPVANIVLKLSLYSYHVICFPLRLLVVEGTLENHLINPAGDNG